MHRTGYIVGTLPSQFVQMKVRPSWWLPTLELIWGALVMCMAAAPNYQTIYGIRFLVGICEASAYPGMMTLLGNWYTPQELGKRSVIFQQSSAVAQMFSGWVKVLSFAVSWNGADLILDSFRQVSTTAWMALVVFEDGVGCSYLMGSSPFLLPFAASGLFQTLRQTLGPFISRRRIERPQWLGWKDTVVRKLLL